MRAKQESIDWVPVQDIVLGSNARTVEPSKHRKGKHTPMKVVNDAAAHLTANTLKVPNGTAGTWLLLNDDVTEHIFDEGILDALVNGEAIEALQ